MKLIVGLNERVGSLLAYLKLNLFILRLVIKWFHTLTNTRGSNFLGKSNTFIEYTYEGIHMYNRCGFPFLHQHILLVSILERQQPNTPRETEHRRIQRGPEVRRPVLGNQSQIEDLEHDL